MAQSPTTQKSRDVSQPYHTAWQAISRLLLSGQSWSGHERNCSFLNLEGRTFADVSAVTGLDFIEDGRAVAIVDWDLDGDLDFWLTNRNAPRLRYIRNENLNGLHFIAFRLQGLHCQRDAIGARLELKLAGKNTLPLIKTLRAGEGFLSQSSKWVHFGLGKNVDIEFLRVRWPDGTESTVRGLAADRRYVVTQGNTSAELWPTPTTSRLSSSVIEPPTDSSVARIIIRERKQLPQLHFRGMDGATHELNPSTGRPRLIQLWASWCAPCRAELSDFTAHEQQIRDAQLDIVAACIDELNVDDAASKHSVDASSVRDSIRSVGYPFETGMLTRRAADVLERGPGLYLNMNAPLPIPSSFLLDNRGRVAVIYTGPTSAEQVIHDLSLLSASSTKLLREAVPFPGRWNKADWNGAPDQQRPATTTVTHETSRKFHVQFCASWLKILVLAATATAAWIYFRRKKR